MSRATTQPGAEPRAGVRIGVLAVQGAFAEHIAMLRSLGVDAVAVRLPVDLDGIGGLILPGGESTTMRKLIARWGLAEPIQRLAAAGAPLLGTCAGMILLARHISDGDEPFVGAGQTTRGDATINGVGPGQLRFEELRRRLEPEGVTELIVATNPTVEGDATAMYIAREYKPLGLRVTRLASGLPVGGDLDYADELTLGRALTGRSEL